VLHHFGADVTDFIKFIPRSVAHMAPLALTFHTLLLRSLLASFGRSPCHDFVRCVTLLVALNPAPLAAALMEFVLSNRLDKAVLALGPQLLAVREIAREMTPAWVEAFAEVALTALADTGASTSDFERACGTLAHIVRNAEGAGRAEMVRRIAERKRADYPKHLHKLVLLLLLLPLPFDELEVTDDDANTIKCAKLRAIARLVEASDNLEVARRALRAFRACAGLHGDGFTALVEAVNDNFCKLEGVDDACLGDLVGAILTAESGTWVQDSATLRLATTIGLDASMCLIPEFEEIVGALALRFAVSLQDDLAAAALESLRAYVNYQNIETIIGFLMTIDCFDPLRATRLLWILNALVEALSPESVSRMAGIVGDMILFYTDSPEIAGEAFLFMTKCGFFKVSKRGMETCIDWITRMYKAITHNDSAVVSPLKMAPLPLILTSGETDVVASDIASAVLSMRPLLRCYMSFIMTSWAPSPMSACFTMELVKLFPYEVLPCAAVHVFSGMVDYLPFCSVVASILRNESSHATAARCCAFMAEAPPDVSATVVTRSSF